MLLRIGCRSALFVLLVANATWAANDTRPPADPLHTLRASHPRLIVLDDDVERVRKLLATKSPDAIKLHDALRKSAGAMLNAPPVEYQLIGPRLLDKSRTALRRITTLAGLYRLDGDKAFAVRAIREMQDVCAFKDWHPPHFLDTAEMTAAVALGYDWLYDVLTPEQRKTFRDAIRDKGLEPGLGAYTATRPSFWTTAHHNWAQVCGGGLTLGALAIGDEEPQISAEILRRTYPTVLGGMEALSPDGGCPEGPGYWNYATQYNVYCLAALESALGTDWGLGRTPGFALTGLFPIYTTGPTLKAFNYADAGEGRIGNSPQLFWMARRYHRPEYASFERSAMRPDGDVFGLFWLDPEGAFPPVGFPRDAIFRHVGVATFRSGWEDPDATFVAFKGGSNAANHAHLDLGSFVLDALGRRWAVDLGADDYNLPGYFGAKRWTYYRLRTEGHNTLTIDGENQDPAAKAPLLAFGSGPGRALAVADLTAAYAKHVTRATRGIELLDRSRVLVVDEIEATRPVDVVWNFHTRAAVEAARAAATLRMGGATLTLRVLSPGDARIEVVSANPSPPQRQQPDVKNLTVRLTGKVTSTRVAVLLTPVVPGRKPMPNPNVDPLSAWIGVGPLEATGGSRGE